MTDNVKNITIYRTWMVDYKYAVTDGLPTKAVWQSMTASQQEQWLRQHGMLLDTKFSEYLGMDDGEILDYDGKLRIVSDSSVE